MAGISKPCIEALETVDIDPDGNVTYTGAFYALYKYYLFFNGTIHELRSDGDLSLNWFFSRIVMAVEDPRASVRCSAEPLYRRARHVLRFMRKQSSPTEQRQFARFCKLYCRLTIYSPASKFIPVLPVQVRYDRNVIQAIMIIRAIACRACYGSREHSANPSGHFRR